ncbi:MAG: hypothetical protein WCS52_07075 [bacterium]
MNSKRSTFMLVLLAAGLLALAAIWGGHSPSTGPASRDLTADTPPGVRFVSVALGGFRGLLADFLWVRAASLQDEGRFFEVAQLSDWITRLEPRYPEIWAYHAWNMAYNITAVVSDPADRWHWVKNGIRLLRDEGIPSNPSNAKLYWELGWMFFDKVGGRWDEAAPYYRIAWAGEMTQLLGGGLADYPMLLKQGKAAPLLASLGLNVEVMNALDRAYGPLDWRLPETHAMYWGYRGKSLASADAVWCDRLVWMALTETVKGGALVYLPEQRRYQRGPRLDVAMKAIRHCANTKPAGDPLVSLAVTVLLKESALYLYAFDRPLEANTALQELKREKADGIAGEMTLEAFIQKEVADRATGLDQVGREKLVVDWLVRSEIWRRLGVPAFAAGYDRIARLHGTPVAGADGSDKIWQALRQKAAEQALLEMP